MASRNGLQDRLHLLRTSGIPVSDAEEKRVMESVQPSLAALDAAVPGSLFDTEPRLFDAVLRKLAKAHRHD